MSALTGELMTLIIPLLLETATVFLLGLISVPLLRSRRTGRLEWRIGRRTRADGSEPAMGGAVAAAAFAVWFFPLAAIADLRVTNSAVNSRGGLIFAGVYVIIIVCAGAADDRLKYFRSQPAGLPAVVRQLYLFAASLFLLLGLAVFGGRGETAVLLPFGLGYIEFGWTYYPLMALAMTLCVNCFKLHFCFGGRERDFVGGLNEVSGGLSLLTVGICCGVCTMPAGSTAANISACACIGMLMWTLPPSKLISGTSGAYFAGAAFAAAVMLSKLELLLITAALPQLFDTVWAAVHFMRLRHSGGREEGGAPVDTKRPLHSFLRARGYGEYAVILVFFVMSLIGAAVSVLFALYARNVLIPNY